MSDIGNMSNYDRRQRAMARDAEQKRDEDGKFGSGGGGRSAPAGPATGKAKEHMDRSKEHKAKSKKDGDAHHMAYLHHQSAASAHHYNLPDKDKADYTSKAEAASKKANGS